MPTPSSRAVGTISSSSPRVNSDHSLWSAVIGWTASAARSVSALTSDSPRWRTLPGLHELAHRAHALLDRHARVAAVHVVEVDVVHAEARAARRRRPRGSTRGGCRSSGRRVVAADGELGGELHLVAAAVDGAAHELLVVARPVHVGGVEEGHAQVERATDRRGRLVLVGGSVELGHPHAAESDGGYLEVSELALVHASFHVLTVPRSLGPARPARTRAAGA